MGNGKRGGVDPVLESKPSANLQVLRALTHTLPPAPISSARGLGEVDFFRYPTEGGTALAWPLFARKDIGVANFFLSKGTVYKAHAHAKEREFLIVYAGRLRFLGAYNTNCPRLKPGNAAEPGMVDVVIEPGSGVCIDPGNLHSAEALEDTWIIAITVPKTPEYPE